jgi:hypothetical protein
MLRGTWRAISAATSRKRDVARHMARHLGRNITEA